ncbi:MAG: leucyl/phenylalanyl-tRNA--protein transferase [bacterium]|jgi:leucyl/phenylalanyl-tRNA--protein transferase
MPVYRLMRDLPVFPSPQEAEPDGLLAIGGDLNAERLIEAYANGIFPWYEEGQPLLWWSPDPRLLLYPEDIKVSRSLRKVLRKHVFQVTIDQAFPEVIAACAKLRLQNGQGTWITQAMREAYTRLNEQGLAHSLECWHQGNLVGGLYGVSLGRAFFGESMFSRESNASKVALVALAGLARSLQIQFIDCQMPTTHLLSMGAREIPRSEFLIQLQEALKYPTLQGSWVLTESSDGEFQAPTSD